MPILHRRIGSAAAYFCNLRVSDGRLWDGSHGNGDGQMQRFRFCFFQCLCVGAVASLLALPAQIARADEGGVSFWLPGFFGSLAAVPAQTPGWSVTSIYWHDSVHAAGDVARAREIEIGRIPANLSANLSANLNSNLDLTFLIGTYTFATPVLGGQASF